MNGYRTYICAAALAVATFAKAMGWIDESQYTVIAGLIASGGLAALRAAVPGK